jgi:hypothetical protein
MPKLTIEYSVDDSNNDTATNSLALIMYHAAVHMVDNVVLTFKTDKGTEVALTPEVLWEAKDTTD